MNRSVSIVIPCYNQGHLVSQAIDSSIGQTYNRVEVIVVNDGSKDNTEQIVRRYGARVKYLYQDNSGLSAARNTGLENASGDFLFFLDSDDLIDPRTIESLVALATQDGCNLVQCGWKLFRNIEDLQTSTCHTPINETLMPLLIQQNVGPVHSFLVERELAACVGGFETELDSCEDWDFWTRCVHAGVTFSTIPNAYAFYRQSPNSMSTNLQRMLLARTEVFLRTWDLLMLNSVRYFFGHSFAEVASRLRRRFLARNLKSHLYERLCDISADLESRGILTIHQGKKQIISKFLTTQSVDELMIYYYRMFDRKEFSRYANQIY
jgi:glycosyltransferase involved in cell wall biosynthesis